MVQVDIARMPRACCKTIVEKPIPRMSSTLGTYWRTAKTFRLAAFLVTIGWKIGEDLAEIQRIIGNVYEWSVNIILPPVPVPKTARTAVAASPSAPMDVSRPAPHLSSALAFTSEYHETMENVGAVREDTDIVDLDKKPNTTTMDDQMDEFRTLKASTAVVPLISYNVVSPQLSNDDEGYGSSDDTVNAAAALALTTLPSEVPAQDPGSLSTLSSASGHGERRSVDTQAHPSKNSHLHPNASTTTIAQIRPIRRKSSSLYRVLRPGPQILPSSASVRCSSYSSAEAKRLLEISTAAAARAHHHWLRPCDACVRKAEKGTGRKMERNRLRKACPSEEGTIARLKREEKVDRMVKRTRGWVRKQEEKMRHT